MRNRAIYWLTGTLLLAGCASTPPSGGGGDAAPLRPAVDPFSVPDAVPRVEPRSRYGNPETYVVFGKTYRVMPDSTGFRQTGDASWYGTKFHGRRTSSGEPYNMYAMTAAHKTLPLPAYVRVTHRDTGRQIVVRVNDRGPFHPGRIIDLSYTAAAKLGILETGSGPVEIEVIDPQQPRDPAPWPPVSRAEEVNNANSRWVPNATPAPPPAATAASTAVPDISVPPPGGSNMPDSNEPWAVKPIPLPPSGPPPAAAVAQYYLQAGAYRDPVNANERVDWLRKKGLSGITVREAQVSGLPLQRVYIGPFTSLPDAERTRNQLRELHIEPRLITE